MNIYKQKHKTKQEQTERTDIPEEGEAYDRAMRNGDLM